MEIIILFLISLFGTFIVVRIIAHNFHDMTNYDRFNPKNSKAKTITGILRRKTGFDWHHIHLGIFILLIVIPWSIIKGLDSINIILLGIGLSLVADQITPLIDRKSNYFSKEKLIISLMFHIVIALIAIVLKIS